MKMKGRKKIRLKIDIEPQDYMPLIIRYRPNRLEDFIGNTDTIRRLKPILDNPVGAPKSFFISGPVGCGKTTLARIMGLTLTKGVNWGIEDINCAYITKGLHKIEELIASMHYSFSEYKVYILDEAHSLSTGLQNALLTKLEEPGEHIYFILCTTEPDKIIDAIKSRCFELPLNPMNKSERLELIHKVMKAEGVTIPTNTVNRIADKSKGIPREALKLLDEVMLTDLGKVKLRKVFVLQSKEEIEEFRYMLKAGEKVISTPLAFTDIEACKEVEVVIIQNKSEEGRQLAEKTFKEISPIAKSCRVVEVPGVKNITFSDWLELNVPGGFIKAKKEEADMLVSLASEGLREWLDEMVDKPEDLQYPSLITTPEQVIKSFSEFKDLPSIPERKIIMQPWLKEGNLVLISSNPGVGKTTLAMEIATACGEGRDAMNGLWKVEKPVPVLFIDGEMEPQDIINMGEYLKTKNVYLISKIYYELQKFSPPLDIADEVVRNILTRHVKNYGIKLLILDNLFSLLHQHDFVSLQNWYPINTWLLTLRAMGVAVIMIHHTSKEGIDQFGSASHTFHIDYSFVLGELDKELCSFSVNVQKQRHRGAEIAGKKYTYDNGVWEVEDFTSQSDRKEESELQLKQIASFYDQGMIAKEIAEELDCSEASISQRKDNLVDQGYLKKIDTPEGEDKRRKLFALTDAGKEWNEST